MRDGATNRLLYVSLAIRGTNNMEFETYGLVIREYPQKEKDKLLTVLTPDLGKISVWASSSRSARSPILAVSQLMAYSRIKLRQTGGRYYLIGGSVENLFFELRNSIESLSLAQYFCELASNVSADGLESKEIVSLLLNAFYLLCKGTASSKIIKAAFEVRLMSYIGYRPSLESCAFCGEVEDSMYFDFNSGYILCKKCMDTNDKRGVYPINRAVYEALNHIINADYKKVFSFKLDCESEEILSKAAEGFLLSQLGIKIKTLEFYNSL